MKLMRNLILSILLISIFGCSNKTEFSNDEKYIVELKPCETRSTFIKEFKVVVIDSCEYLYTDIGSNSQNIFHKGNCKFCKYRNNKK